MKIVLDSSVLIYLAYPNAPAPIDPATNEVVAHCPERIEGLLEDLNESGSQLIVPTPVLSELLIRANDKQLEVLGAVTNRRAVTVVPFDTAAAIENAALRRSRKIAKAAAGETRKEVSFDLQILAIARVAGADLVLTDDQNLRRHCEAAGMRAAGIGDLSLPDSKRQIGIEFQAGNSADAADADQPVRIPPPVVKAPGPETSRIGEVQAKAEFDQSHG